MFDSFRDPMDGSPPGYPELGCLRMQPKVGGKLHLRLNTSTRPMVNKYRKGKLKRTLKKELKKVWRNPWDFPDKNTGISRVSSQPRDQTCISCLAGGFFITEPPGKPMVLVDDVNKETEKRKKAGGREGWIKGRKKGDMAGWCGKEKKKKHLESRKL